MRNSSLAATRVAVGGFIAGPKCRTWREVSTAYAGVVPAMDALAMWGDAAGHAAGMANERTARPMELPGGSTG